MMAFFSFLHSLTPRGVGEDKLYGNRTVLAFLLLVLIIT